MECPWEEPGDGGEQAGNTRVGHLEQAGARYFLAGDPLLVEGRDVVNLANRA
jgi:hypothetical protein